MDFRALKYQERFVELCNHLLLKKDPKVKVVDGSGGDDGIDLFLGEISHPDRVYQVKYFDEIKQTQWKQIEKSLRTVYEKRKPKKWTLMVSCDFSKWNWDKWEALAKKYSDIELDVLSATHITMMINECRKSFIASFQELFPEENAERIAYEVVKLTKQESMSQQKVAETTIYDKYNDKILQLSSSEKSRVKEGFARVGQLFKDTGVTINLEEINVKSISKLAISFYHMGLLQEARFNIDLVLREFSDDLRSLNNKAATYHKESELGEALEWIQKALDIQPDYFDAKVNKGAILVDMDKPEDAVSILEPLFDEKRDDEALLRNLVLGFSKLANEEKTIRYFELAKNVIPNPEIMYNDVGVMYLRISKPKEALEYFDRYLRIYPDNQITIVNKTSALIELGYYILASFILESLIQRNPKAHNAMTNLAMSYFRRGRILDAVHWGLVSLEFDFRDVTTLNLVGSILTTMGDIEEGLSYFNRALEIKGDYAFALANKATNLVLLHKYKEALAYVEEFLKYEPKDHTMLHNRDYLRKILKAKEDAPMDKD